MVTTTPAQLDTIASTIRAQIGNPALFMLGAYGFGAGFCTELGPYFRFNFKGSRKANLVVVYLDQATDTYTLQLRKYSGIDASVVESAEGLHCEQLTETIGSLTGLAVRL